MNSEVLQALISAGIRPADAGRLATAIDSAYSSGQQTSSFSRPEGVGLQADSTPDRFALYASAPGTSLAGEDSQGRTLYGPGGGALGVKGATVLDGDLYSSGAAQVNSLSSQTNINAVGGITSSTASFTDSLQVSDRVSLSDSGVISSVPVVSQSTLVSNTNSQFYGDTVFQGGVSLTDQHLIGGVEVSPTSVQVLGAIAAKDNKLFVLPLELGVSASHGTGVPSTLEFTIGAGAAQVNTTTGINLTGTTAKFLTAASPTKLSFEVPTTATVPAATPFTYVTKAIDSATGTAGSVTVPTYATVPPYTFSAVNVAVGSVTPTTGKAVTSVDIKANAISLTYVTGVTFNPETCDITLSTDSVDVVTAVSATVGYGDFVQNISTSDATAQSHTVGDDGKANLGGGSPYTVITAVTTSAASTATTSGLGASGKITLADGVNYTVISDLNGSSDLALTNVTATLETAPVNITGSGNISISVTQNGI